jgi:hypothetical protein
MESRERTETNREDREQGTPQGQLLDEQPGSSEHESPGGEYPPEAEGGADSAADAAGEGG